MLNGGEMNINRLLLYGLATAAVAYAVAAIVAFCGVQEKLSYQE